MKKLFNQIKGFLKSVLIKLRLYKYARQIRMLPYRNIKTHSSTINGITVQFNTSDELSNSWFFPRYSKGRVHEKIITEMLISTLQTATCFVDVGTFLGWYTCIASKHMPNGKVIGFEMDNISYSLLQENLTLNNCPNVEAYNVAVSNVAEEVRYQRNIKRLAGLHIQVDLEEKSSEELLSVDSVVLDDFLMSRGIVPDVIKIDVEGAEMNVLQGMMQILQLHRPKLFLEIHPFNLPHFGTSTYEILSLLIDHGYEIVEIESMRSQHSQGDLVPLNAESLVEENTMLYAVAMD